MTSAVQVYVIIYFISNLKSEEMLKNARKEFELVSSNISLGVFSYCIHKNKMM